MLVVFGGKSRGHTEILALAVVMIVLVFLSALLGLPQKSGGEEQRDQREHYTQVVAEKYCGRNIGAVFAVDDPRRMGRKAILVERVDGGIAVERVGGKFSRNRYDLIAECPGEVLEYKEDLD